MPATVSSQSREYVVVPVDTVSGGQELDTAVATVEFSFTKSGEPATWHAGDWQQVSQNVFARILVGTGGTVALADGDYTVWLKVTQTPEVVVKPAGRLLVS